MLTKDFVDNFIDTYTSNYTEIRELDDSLLKMMSYAQWKELIVNRSVRVREIFAENDKLIVELKSGLQEGLDKDSAIVCTKDYVLFITELTMITG